MDAEADGQGETTRSLAIPEASRELHDFLAPAEQPDEIGRLGPYRILKVLGHGGMGVVFQGEDPQLGRKVAVKAMLPHVAHSALSRQRFLREARAAAAVEHDHIVAIHQVGEDRGVPFIVMPLLKGMSLDMRLQMTGLLSVSEILRIGRETALGLAAAHAQNLIHRDIKPANLWLEGEQGRVKILDFGLARAVQDQAHLTHSGGFVGTPAYMAPEQANAEAIDHRADLFSLGCVMYRMATGVPPFRGSSAVNTLLAVTTHEPAPPEQLNPLVPAALSALIMELLAKLPNARPASAGAVAERLARLARDSAAPLPRRDVDRPSRPRRLVGGVVLGSAAVLLLALSAYALRGILHESDGGAAPTGAVPVVDPGQPHGPAERPAEATAPQAPPPMPPAERKAPAPGVINQRAIAAWVLDAGGRVTIAELNGNMTQYRTAKELPAGAITLAQVALYDCKTIRDGDLARLEGLRELDVVDLTGTGLSDDALVHLKGMRRLRWLQLGYTNIGDKGLEHIQGLEQLEMLNLAHSRVTDRGLAWLRGLKQLNYLSLDEDRIAGAGLANLKGLGNLRTLSLRGTPITDEALVHLGGLTRLAFLDLQRTGITGAGIAHLQPLDQLGNIDLSRSKITDQELNCFRPLTGLHTLSLGSERITGSGFGTLAELPRLSNLYLYDAPVTDDGLACLRHLSQLRALTLADVPIQGDGLVALQQLTGLTLSGKTVTDRLVPRVAELKQLNFLRLENTAVSDAGLLKLRPASGLQTLSVRSATITPQGLAVLQKHLPACKISSY
jgi:serine/threonine protein kinase